MRICGMSSRNSPKMAVVTQMVEVMGMSQAIAANPQTRAPGHPLQHTSQSHVEDLAAAAEGGGGNPGGPDGGGISSASRDGRRRNRSRSNSSERVHRREAPTIKYDSVPKQGALPNVEEQCRHGYGRGLCAHRRF